MKVNFIFNTNLRPLKLSGFVMGKAVGSVKRKF